MPFRMRPAALHRNARLRWFLAALALLVGISLAAAGNPGRAAAFPPAQTAQEGEAVFRTRCAGCHSVGGGRLVGPDLAYITQKRDRQWLEKFIQDPSAMFAANDPIATALLKEYNNVKMPNLSLTDREVAALLVYLESNGSGAPANASTGAGSAAAGNPQAGELLFTGQRQMANGGASCQACHTVNGVGSLGGGTLGPDLTQVYTRYGENGLNAALTNVTFPSMTGIFAKQPITPQERADLVAFFQQVNARAPAPAGNTWIFLGAAAALMAALFGVLFIFWPRQKQTMSEKLRASRR